MAYRNGTPFFFVRNPFRWGRYLKLYGLFYIPTEHAHARSTDYFFFFNFNN